MSTTTAFLLAIAVSVGGIAYLSAIDQKRTRVFELVRTSRLPRSKLAGWAIVLLPALGLLTSGHVSAFLAWFGALTVSAWLIASTRPKKRREDR
ncbi:MAG: hypothetical protein HC788_00400 [Sphingopyxis sp.]|nr:hypothetical protein [Sphingopyxis sp.]